MHKHARLEQRLKEVEIDHQEAITAMQSKQDTEMIRLKGLLANSELLTLFDHLYHLVSPPYMPYSVC